MRGAEVKVLVVKAAHQVMYGDEIVCSFPPAVGVPPIVAGTKVLSYQTGERVASDRIHLQTEAGGVWFDQDAPLCVFTEVHL